jgi:2-haloacid dehalogenase
VPIKAIVFDAYGTLYDVQSVAAATERAYPGQGNLITQIWRLKQLEYSWLRALMERYEDFWTITAQSLDYTLACLGLPRDAAAFDSIMDAYRHLDLYPDALPTLSSLSDYKRAILSNGSPAMLDELVANSGIAPFLDATISVDAGKTYKPAAAVYDLIRATLDVALSDVLFVSSNGWDVCGAKSAGLTVAWIERVSAEALAGEMMSAPVEPLTMFKALRMRPDTLGFPADYQVQGLSELAAIVSRA